MKNLLWALALLSFLSTPMSAQVTPWTRPSTNASSTITTTNTFQSIWAAYSGRSGCTIQNNGTHTMYVSFGPIANATTANSAQVAPGNSIYCAGQFGVVLRDQVSITGTSGDAFYANGQ
jgi:predicted S18 family serine protease